MRQYLPFLKLFSVTMLTMVLLLSACKKYDDVEVGPYEPEFAIPLLQSSFSIEDVLSRFDDDTFVTIDNEGFVTMNYRGDLTARTSMDIFEFIAQTPSLFPLLDTTMVLPFGTPNGFDLDFAVINNGYARFNYIYDLPEPMDMTIRVPNLLTPTGEVFEFQQYHPIGSPLPFQSDTTHLKDYILKPTNDSIYVEYYAILKDNGERIKLNVITLELQEFTASYVEGYMGNEIYEIPRDTIEIDFFENWTRGEVYFEDPRISVSVLNSFGFPVRSKANIMDIFTADGQVLELQSLYVDSINVDYPRLDEVGESRTTLFYFDKDNSNIDDVLNSNPVAVDYEMRALANPDMDTTIRGFMTDTSQFKIQVEVELPLHGRALGFAARDTLDIDFAKYEKAIAAELKVIADNSLPLEVALQGYFLTADYQVIDSLFQETTPIIGAAAVDDEGEVIEMETLVTYIPVEGERFERLKSAKKMLLTTAFSSYNNGQAPVKIYTDQQVDIRMGMKLTVQQ